MAWLLNLDAELELRRPTSVTPEKTLERMRAQIAQMDPLWRDGDVLVGDGDAGGLEGRAWCPTPRALAALRRAGAIAPEAPSLEVLQRVNHRAFNAALGQTLPGAAFVRDLDALEKHLLSEDLGAGWLMKRPYSFAGTGQRRVWRGALPVGDLAWARASLREDGLQVEPIVDVVEELAAHGFLRRDGGAVFGDFDPALQPEVERVARALHDAGYFGPFGVDAFKYKNALNARSEINARYTMRWARGMGGRRPDV